MISKTALLTWLACGMATWAVADQSNMATPGLKSLSSQQFVDNAAVGNMKEVRLSQLALQTSQNPQVKVFATQMVRDHSAVNNRLEVIANQEHLDFPSTNTFAGNDPMWNNAFVEHPETVKDAYLLQTNMPNFVDYQEFKHVQSLSGRDFDLAYAHAMVNDHINMVNLYTAASGNLPDPNLRKFAADTLPGIREHSQMAQKLENQVASQTAGVQGNKPAPRVATANDSEK